MKSAIKIICLFLLFTLVVYFVVGNDIYIYFLRFSQSELFGPVVSFLLAIDLFLSIPTFALCILSGKVLGVFSSFLFVSLGLLIAGNIGYWLGFFFGQRVVNFILKDDALNFLNHFKRNAITLIILSRAVPMLPEACALLSGSTKLGYSKFMIGWCLNTFPYALYSCSIGAFTNESSYILAISGIILFYLVSAIISFFIFKKNTKLIQ